MNVTTELLTVFQRKERFLLLVHYSPDGDAIASSLGLYLVLRSLSKTVDVVCADDVPAQFAFLPAAQCIKRDFLLGDYDVVVTLDCGDSRRTGFARRLKDIVRQKKMTLVNIDHHPKNDLHDLATYNYIDFTAPSTSYLVCQLARQLGVSINHKMATCFLTGLYTDTGGFKHPNTTPVALHFASELLSYGARLRDITTNITQPSSVTRLKLWGMVLGRIQRHPRYDIVITYVTADDLAKVGACEDDIAGIAALLGTIPAQVSVLVVRMHDGRTQVRMRTKHASVNLVPLVSYLGGGGQKKAAGFSLVTQGK